MTKCPSSEALVALWAGELGEADVNAMEEHVFECDSCAVISERFARLVEGLREVIPFVISNAQRDRLAAKGTRMSITTVDPSVKARARFVPEIDLMVFALRADLSRAESVDVDVLFPDGKLGVALEHVAFDRDSGELLIACQRHFEGMFNGDPIFRVHTRERGQRRSIGDYVVMHEWR